MIAEPPVPTIVGTVVTVTQEDIDAGCIGNTSACPVARAVARVAGPARVFGARVDLYDHRAVYRASYFLPGHVTSWIVRFDHGEPVSPFSFEIGVEL